MLPRRAAAKRQVRNVRAGDDEYEADFDALRSQVRSVPAVAASTPVSGVLNDGTQTSAFFGQAVTGNYFSMMRFPIALGRGIQEADDRPDANPVVVLSHEFWRSKTGGDPKLVGQTVRINGRPFVVIGVVAQSLRNRRDLNGQFGIVNGEAWIPLAAKTPPATTQIVPANPGTTEPEAAGATGAAATRQSTIKTTANYEAGLTVVARLAAGTTIWSVAAEVGRPSPGPHRIGCLLRDHGQMIGVVNRRGVPDQRADRRVDGRRDPEAQCNRNNREAGEYRCGAQAAKRHSEVSPELFDSCDEYVFHRQ